MERIVTINRSIRSIQMVGRCALHSFCSDLPPRSMLRTHPSLRTQGVGARTSERAIATERTPWPTACCPPTDAHRHGMQARAAAATLLLEEGRGPHGAARRPTETRTSSSRPTSPRPPCGSPPRGTRTDLFTPLPPSSGPRSCPTSPRRCPRVGSRGSARRVDSAHATPPLRLMGMIPLPSPHQKGPTMPERRPDPIPAGERSGIQRVG